MYPNEFFCRAACEVSEIQENPPNMVMIRKTILTQGYELPLNAFKLYRVPYS
jgi:hypothetical protein